jgi:hypothetical protein
VAEEPKNSPVRRDAVGRRRPGTMKNYKRRRRNKKKKKNKNQWSGGRKSFLFF